MTRIPPNRNRSAGSALCTRINACLRSLGYRYDETAERQQLAIDGFPPVYFSANAGGTAAGGSPGWIRAKHADGGLHEPGMLAILMVLAGLQRPVRTIFDVGALYGYFSLLCSSLFDGPNVYAFEMNPGSFAALTENLAVNGHLGADRIRAVNCAVSDVSERKKSVAVQGFSLNVPEKALARTRLAKAGLEFRTAGVRALLRAVGDVVATSVGRRSAEPGAAPVAAPGDTEVALDFWSIDDFCAEAGVTPDLIKIDVEGFQSKIVPGGLKTFEQTGPFILLEFDDPLACNSLGVSNRKVAEPLFDLGYQLVWGDHRSPQGSFAPLQWAQFGSRQETNSLGLFFMEDRLT